MLKWEKDTNGYIEFDDDCPLYRVGKDENGWCYEYLPDADGWDDLEPLSPEELEEAYWDDIAHERMEIAKGLC